MRPSWLRRWVVSYISFTESGGGYLQAPARLPFLSYAPGCMQVHVRALCKAGMGFAASQANGRGRGRGARGPPGGEGRPRSRSKSRADRTGPSDRAWWCVPAAPVPAAAVLPPALPSSSVVCNGFEKLGCGSLAFEVGSSNLPGYGICFWIDSPWFSSGTSSVQPPRFGAVGIAACCAARFCIFFDGRAHIG